MHRISDEYRPGAVPLCRSDVYRPPPPPRCRTAIDTINRQAVLCHRVLRTVQSLSNESARLETDTWSTLLLFLLTVNDSLLSPPTVKGQSGSKVSRGQRSVRVKDQLRYAGCGRQPSLYV